MKCRNSPDFEEVTVFYPFIAAVPNCMSSLQLGVSNLVELIQKKKKNDFSFSFLHVLVFRSRTVEEGDKRSGNESGPRSPGLGSIILLLLAVGGGRGKRCVFLHIDRGVKRVLTQTSAC